MWFRIFRQTHVRFVGITPISACCSWKTTLRVQSCTISTSLWETYLFEASLHPHDDLMLLLSPSCLCFCKQERETWNSQGEFPDFMEKAVAAGVRSKAPYPSQWPNLKAPACRPWTHPWLIQLCWEALWPKNWPANSSSGKKKKTSKLQNISTYQLHSEFEVGAGSPFGSFGVISNIFQSPIPKTEGVNSSSKVQLTLTILSHRQCRAVGRVLVASNMEILRQRISANQWNTGASTSSKTLRDRTTGNSRDWTIEYGYWLLLNIILATKLCAAQGTAHLVMMGPACLGTAGHSRALLRAMLEIMVQLKMIFSRRWQLKWLKPIMETYAMASAQNAKDGN